MSDGTRVVRCPVCRQPTLNVGASAPGTPPMLLVVDGETRVLKPAFCRTCTAVWHFYGEVDRIDWEAIARVAAEHEDRGGP